MRGPYKEDVLVIRGCYSGRLVGEGEGGLERVARTPSGGLPPVDTRDLRLHRLGSSFLEGGSASFGSA